MRAEVISIGTELVGGLTVDTNAAWLAGELAAVGVQTVRHVTVADDRAAIADEVRLASGSADVVVVTGGLGPTDDDVTREAVADAMGVALRRDPGLLETTRAFFRQRNLAWIESNARQADLPDGAEPIANPWGTAPGFRARVGRALVFCLPGVPREMKKMFAASVLPALKDAGAAGVVITRALHCFGAGEARMAEQIADLMAPGRAVTVGVTANEGVISVRFIAAAANRDEAEAAIDRDVEDVRRRLGDLVFGAESQTLSSVVGGLLADRGRTVAVAESCTGGLVAKSLTDVSGSSAYFLCGMVTYSNQAKTDLLGVDPQVINANGAVSEEVARAMAIGCRQRSGADFALATTGIAGPTGGSPEKPVGLVYISVADADACEVKRCLFGEHRSRSSIRQLACSTVLNMLRLRLAAGA